MKEIKANIIGMLMLILIASMYYSCKEESVPIPKPRMYPKVNYPTVQGYQAYDNENCPFSFEYPQYASIHKSKAYNKNKAINDCWFDVSYADLHAVLYCSYSDIIDMKAYQEMIDKNYLLVNKHNRKAEYINESIILKNKKSIGVQFEIEGKVATPFQFFMTDTLHHFFRASLYFNAPPNPDSLAPIYKFVKKDIDHMISTFDWK